MEGLASLKTFGHGFRRAIANRPAPCPIGILPSQPVVLSGRTDDPLRVLIHPRVVVNLERVLLLGIVVAAEDGDYVEFVFTDAPTQYLVVSGFVVEVPFPVFALDDRDGQWPIVVADGNGDHGLVFGVWDQLYFFLGLGREFESALLVLDGILGSEEIVGTLAHDLE